MALLRPSDLVGRRRLRGARPAREGRSPAATISPEEITGLHTEEEATLVSLQHADWLGAILGVVRAGAGSDASPVSLVEAVRTCPEIEDADDRLTPPGGWVLPRVLARAWHGDFDQPAGHVP